MERSATENPIGVSMRDSQTDNSTDRIYLSWCLSEFDLKNALKLLLTAKIAVHRAEIVRAYEQVAGGVIELESGSDAIKAFQAISDAGFRASMSRACHVGAIEVPDPIITEPSIEPLSKAS